MTCQMARPTFSRDSRWAAGAGTQQAVLSLLACPSCPLASAREAQWWPCTGAVTELQPNGGAV